MSLHTATQLQGNNSTKFYKTWNFVLCFSIKMCLICTYKTELTDLLSFVSNKIVTYINKFVLNVFNTQERQTNFEEKLEEFYHFWRKCEYLVFYLFFQSWSEFCLKYSRNLFRSLIFNVQKFFKFFLSKWLEILNESKPNVLTSKDTITNWGWKNSAQINKIFIDFLIFFIFVFLRSFRQFKLPQKVCVCFGKYFVIKRPYSVKRRRCLQINFKTRTECLRFKWTLKHYLSYCD